MAISQNDEVKKLYGEFMIEFEFVCSKIRFLMLKVVFPGYDLRERNIVDIFTEGLTADQLRRKCLALIGERFSLESDIYKATKKVSDLFGELIPVRNSFAHGTPFIGNYDFIENSKRGTLLLRHPKLKSTGLDLNFKSFDRKKIKNSVEAFTNLQAAYMQIGIIVKYYDKPELWKKTYFDQITNSIRAIDIKNLTQ